MVALVGAVGGFHLAQQGVHFRQGEAAVGADGAITGHGGQDFVVDIRLTNLSLVFLKT